jgi:hypothetical protein
MTTRHTHHKPPPRRHHAAPHEAEPEPVPEQPEEEPTPQVEVDLLASFRHVLVVLDRLSGSTGRPLDIEHELEQLREKLGKES